MPSARSKQTADPAPTSGRVLGYTRVSTGAQAEEGYSLAAQAHELRRWAEYQRLELVEPIFEDAGISGRHNLRPGLEALLTQVRPGDTVATYALSRLARGGAMQTLALVERIQQAGARLVLLKEQLDSSTPTGRLLLVILAELALMESEQMRERSELGRLQAAREGRLPQGSMALPHALTADEDGRPVWDEVEARAIRRLYQLRETLPLRAIAGHLEAEGHASPRGLKTWDNTTVHALLRNPAYKGELVYRQDRERIVIPVPPLIHPEQWARVQARGTGYRSHTNPDKYPLTGHVVCTCGNRLQGFQPPVARETHTVHRYYMCGSTHRGTPTCPSNGKIRRLWNADALEAAYLEALAELFTNRQDPLRIRAAFVGAPPEDPHAQERADAEAMLAELLDLRLKGLVSRPAYEAQYAALTARVRSLAPVPQVVPDAVEIPDLSHLADLARRAPPAMLAELLDRYGIVGKAHGESRGRARGLPRPPVTVELIDYKPLA